MVKHKNPNNNRELNNELDTLFRFVPPQQLKKSIHEIYSIYLQNVHSLDFKELAMDLYFLNKFLEEAEEKWKK